MRHFVGGWPENVDGTVAEQVDRYLKKANKETSFKEAMQSLAKTVEQVVRQNNTVDVFEEYFVGGATAGLSLSADPPTAKGVAVFRDPCAVKRSVTSVSWHPEGTRIAVAYSVLKFQDERMMNPSERLSPNGYVWDVANPNAPIIELAPTSPLVCVRFNFKTPDIVIGGSYNGLVHVFDIKKPRSVQVTSSSIDRSHHDPVYDVFWIQSKTNSQFASVSTDGRMLWWDTRKLSEPTDEVSIQDAGGRLLGGTSMDYNIEAGPTKYIVGTEQGIVLQLNMKKKGGADKGGGGSPFVPQDAGPGRHHGPIYTVQRNPYHPNNFMTIGDWHVRMWNEKNKPPIMQTPYCKAYVTCGSWSPTRAGLFFVGRQDGVLDAWDFYYRQSSPTYSHKVSDAPLTCVAIQGSAGTGGGRLIAVGDQAGTVSLLEVSDALAVMQPNEKLLIGALFDRESKREEALEKRAIARARAAKLKKADSAAAPAAPAEDAEEELPPEMLETLTKVDTDFAALVEKNRAADAAAAAAAEAEANKLGGSSE
jgi:dynein intermediate chain 2